MAELDALMASYQQGDAQATKDLIARVSPLLYRYFVGQGATSFEAEDLLQDTWLRIHKARHTYRMGEPVMPWAYAIARYSRIDGYRRSRRIRSHEQSVDELPELPASRAHADQSDGGNFEAMIAVLPASQREVVSMLKDSGMSLEEVAKATASSVGAVKLKAHRAYEKLRSILRKDEPTKRGDRLGDAVLGPIGGGDDV